MHEPQMSKPLSRLAWPVMLALMLCLGLFPPAWAEDQKQTDHLIKQRVGDFEAGTRIAVCWRKVSPGNPFLASGPFDCKTAIKAVKAPFPGGAINGDQLMDVIKKAFGAAKIKEVRIRALQVGKDAADAGASLMTVSAGSNEFYNNYVGRESSGRLAVFLDVEPAP